MSNVIESGKIKATKALWTIAALIIAVTGLKLAQSFLLPILIAFFIATVSFPILNYLREKKVPRFLAVFLTVAFDFVFLALLAVLAITLVGELQEKWNTKYAAEASQKIREGSVFISKKLSENGVVDADKKVQEVVNNNVSNLQNIRFEKIWDVGTGVIGKLLSFLAASLLVLILTVFMLSEARIFGRRFQAIKKARGPDLSRLLSATKDIQRYLAIKTVISAATGFLAGLLCWAAGLDFYVLWGILAFFLNFIPVIGSIVAGVPPTVLALMVEGIPSAILVAIGYLVINNFLGNFLEPMLVGRRFGISTLVVVVSVVFWGWLWGPLGMLLAVPLTMVLKVILESSDEFRWIGVAISSTESNGDPQKSLVGIIPSPTEPVSDAKEIVSN